MCIHCTWSDLNGTTQEYNTKDKTQHMILDKTWCDSMNKTCMYIVPVYDTTHGI